ncbi:UDP-galactose transporter [Gonapodya sp. JEL0774]|nr:UDP-galactose transporter [Gonapodya sp. JEL0774]
MDGGTRYAHLAFCVAGVYVCFLTWGVLQERVTSAKYPDPRNPDAPPQKFKWFVFMNLIQSITATFSAFLFIRVRGLTIGSTSLGVVSQYARISFIHSLASPFGYAALKHIDYPTFILGKSCKLVPVILMGWLLYGKTYPFSKVAGVALITTGVSLFMLLQPADKGGKHAQESSNLWGLMLLGANLAIDGITNASQDAVFKQFKVTSQQLMLWMNLFSSLIMATWLVGSNPWNGDLTAVLAFCSDHPAVVKDILIFSLAGGVGQLFIFYTLGSFGSLVLVTVTVTRKMFSILLSVLWFGHELTVGQWFAVAMVFGGIALEDLVDKLGLGKTFRTMIKERVSTTPFPNPANPEDPPVKFKFFVFLNMAQSAAAAACAFLAIRARGHSLGTPSRELFMLYARAAGLNSIASPLGYTSLKHIDYPTMLLGKSCKLVPVMAVGALVYRTRYPWYKVVGVILITIGVSAFMILHEYAGNAKSKPGGPTGNSLFGLGLLATNLVIDGLTNSTQDYIFRQHRVTSQQMMLWMNFCAAAIMFVWLLLSEPWSRELSGALTFMTTHVQCAADVGLFVVCGAIGQLFIFHTLGAFGSIVLVTVTVTRKMLSIILSVVWFGHQLTFTMWLAVAVVFLGVTFEDLAARLGWDALVRRQLPVAAPRLAAFLGVTGSHSKVSSRGKGPGDSDGSGEDEILPGGTPRQPRSGFRRLRTRQREEMSAVANGSLGELLRGR